jgi:hypothetical protein
MKHLKDEPLEPPPIPVPAAPSAATAPSAAAGLAAAAALYSAVAQANAAAAAAAAAAGIPSSKKDDETEEDGEVCALQLHSLQFDARSFCFFCPVVVCARRAVAVPLARAYVLAHNAVQGKGKKDDGGDGPKAPEGDEAQDETAAQRARDAALEQRIVAALVAPPDGISMSISLSMPTPPKEALPKDDPPTEEPPKV